MKSAVFIALSVLGVAAAVPAAAQVVYDNGAPDDVGGNEATAWIQTEDFLFANNTTINGAGVFIGGVGGIGSFDGLFNYYIYDDVGGIPGSILSSGSVGPTIADTGIPFVSGGNIFQFAFGFGDFNAVGGTLYHLGIHLNNGFERDELYWATTAPNATTRGIESFGGALNNWSDNGQEHAFYLTGPSGVPEPATWALLFLGFAAIGGAMRAQKRRQTVAVHYS